MAGIFPNSCRVKSARYHITQHAVQAYEYLVNDDIGLTGDDAALKDRLPCRTGHRVAWDCMRHGMSRRSGRSPVFHYFAIRSSESRGYQVAWDTSRDQPEPFECICTRATSAPGLGSPLQHIHRDWARPSHICPGIELTRAHICTGDRAHSSVRRHACARPFALGRGAARA
jgi:hypothetical protein